MQGLREFFVLWGYVLFSVLALLAFVAPLVETITPDNPTGGAGVYAPIIALCTAAMAILESVVTEEQGRIISKIFIAVGALASSYLWIAEGAKMHPFEPTLSLQLLLLFGLTGLLTVAIPLWVVIGKAGQSPR